MEVVTKQVTVNFTLSGKAAPQSMKSCLSILITLGALVQGTFAGQQTRKLLIEAQTTGAYSLNVGKPQ